MSLIADALKAAQRDKEKRAGKPAAQVRRPQVGRVSLKSAPDGNTNPWRVPMIAVGALAGGVLLFFAVLSVLPNGDDPLAEPSPYANAPVEGDGELGVLDSPSPVEEEVDPFGIRPSDGEPAPPPSNANEPGWLSDEGPPLTQPAAQPRDNTEIAAAASERAPPQDAPVNEPQPNTVSDAPGNTLRITVQGSGSTETSALFADAVAAHRAGDRARAKSLYRQVIAADPTNADAYNNLGTAHRIDQEFNEAEAAYRRALAINPAFAAAWSNLGLVLEARGRSTDAAAAYQRALDLDPANAGTKVNLATQYYRAGLYPEALRLLDDAVRTEPMLAEAHYTRGLVLEAQRDVPGAIRAFNLFLNTANGRFAELEARVREHLNDLVGSG